MDMHVAVRRYMAEIGRLGGRKSRRALDPGTAKRMVRVREARRAYDRFQVSCFWSFDPAKKITEKDVPWVAERLRRNGGRSAWETAARLCP